MLKISHTILDQIRSEAEAAYPEEGCGILLGLIDADTLWVKEVVAVLNQSDSPRNRYVIAPADVINAIKRARNACLEVVGFYHSHPDHPAEWSSTDLSEAHWLDCFYLITSIITGEAKDMKCSRLAGTSEDDKRFVNEKIVVVEP